MKRSVFSHYTARASQLGLSLIELMIAMLIGSILILGITQIFITNQKTYLFQQGQVGNQENGRFTLAVLEQELSKAGYRSYPSQTMSANNSAVAGCNFPQGTAVVALSTTQLCLQYQAANQSDVTCQGTALANPKSIAKPYGGSNAVIVELIAFDSTTNSITCTTANGTQQLVNGVADFRFDYGWGDNKVVNTFGPSPSTTVGAVRYAALMQNPGTTRIRDNTAAPAALTAWNTRYSAAIPDNNQIYQIVQGTVMLRNQLP